MADKKNDNIVMHIEVGANAVGANALAKANTTINSMTINSTTLQYLTNPLYQKEFKKSGKTIEELNKEQCSFYKKRIIALTKSMLKGEYPSEHLEKIHKEYIKSLINHFKRVDEIELIQNEYSDLSASASASASANDLVDICNNNIQINNSIMMKKNKPVSLDNFITKKVIKIQNVIPIPKKRVFNVNTPAHKIKGIPPKQLKDNI
jgi:hypothetical protein